MGLGQQTEQTAEVVPAEEEGGFRFPSLCGGLVYDLVGREQPSSIYLTVPVWNVGPLEARIEFNIVYLVKKEFLKIYGELIIIIIIQC